MQKFSFTIQDELGIHARPAGLIVREAGKFASDIIIRKDEKTADAKRLFNIMSLAAKRGDVIIVTISGEDEEQAANALKEFLTANL